MKKIFKMLSLVLAVMIALGCFSGFGAVVSAEQSDIFIYVVDGSSAVLTGVTSSASGDIVVPEKLGGCTVTMVKGAFAYNSKITSVVLPDDITVITKESFEYCTSLKSVTLPQNLAKIGEAAFSGCIRLTDLVIPDSVTEMGNYAFAWCESLNSVKLSENLLKISKGAFFGCENLASITIPEKVGSIEQDAFSDTALFRNLDSWDDGVLYIGKHLFKAKESVVGRCELRSDTKSITDYAFSGCSMLKELVIYLPTKKIGQSVVFNCANLTDIYYAGTVADRKKMIIPKNSASFTDKPTWHYEYDPDVKEYAPGDINGDDAVNNKDILRLFKYLSDWQVEVQDTVLDTNGDKAVNNKDLTRLFQYLSGWNMKIYSKNICPYEDGDDYGSIVEF